MKTNLIPRVLVQTQVVKDSSGAEKVKLNLSPRQFADTLDQPTAEPQTVAQPVKPTNAELFKKSGQQLKAAAIALDNGLSNGLRATAGSIGVGIKTALATLSSASRATYNLIAGLIKKTSQFIMNSRPMTPVRNARSAKFVAKTESELPGAELAEESAKAQAVATRAKAVKMVSKTLAQRSADTDKISSVERPQSLTAMAQDVAALNVEQVIARSLARKKEAQKAGSVGPQNNASQATQAPAQEETSTSGAIVKASYVPGVDTDEPRKGVAGMFMRMLFNKTASAA